jgi:V-type H+-transporting ATPase subunit E
MIRFIKQEAEEKARELMFEAEEEFNVTKQQLVQQEKGRLNKEFERKEQQLETKKKIEYSQKLNEVRVRVLTARQAALDHVVEEARKKLVALTRDAAGYRKLLAALICQGAKTLDLPTAYVRGRKEDAKRGEAAVEEAKALYTQTYKKQPPKLVFDTRHHLASGPTGHDDPDAVTCIGGVAVTSEDFRISVNNTLDDRLKILVQANLPTVRTALFGAN